MEHIALVITVKNEQESITDLLDAICKQTVVLNECIIVDAGSVDKTQEKILEYKKKLPSLVLHVIPGVGRSEGRNIAIHHAQSEIIAITDAGCIPNNDWIEQIIQPFKDPACDCVAGYYTYPRVSPLREAMAAYMLVLPSKYNPDVFLPATRSMAIRKSVWKQAGKFREDLNVSEDYAFAKKLQKMGKQICANKNAVVAWIPPKTLSEFLSKIMGFAYYDGKASILRPKVITIFMRYFVFALLLYFLFPLGIFVLCVYAGWSMVKQRKDVSFTSLLYMPLLQFLTDITVMIGTIRGRI